MTSVLLRQQLEGVLTLTLNRPEQLNALTWELMRLLNEALSDAAKAYLVCEPESDEAIAALHFSAGRAIRNRWLYGPKGEKLMSELKGLGVTTRDGGSAAVILSARSILRPQAKP